MSLPPLWLRLAVIDVCLVVLLHISAVGRGVHLGRCYYFQQFVVMVIKQLPALERERVLKRYGHLRGIFSLEGSLHHLSVEREIRFVTATLLSSWWCRFCWTDSWAETQPKCFSRPWAIFSSLSCCVRTAVYMSHIRADIWFLVSFCGVTQRSQLAGPWPERLSQSQAVSEASLLSTCSKTCQLSSVFTQCSVKCGVTATAEV